MAALCNRSCPGRRGARPGTSRPRPSHACPCNRLPPAPSLQLHDPDTAMAERLFGAEPMRTLLKVVVQHPEVLL